MSAARRRRWRVPLEEGCTTALFEPARNTDGGDLVVFGHGAGGHRAHPMMDRLAETLRTAGLGVVRFDFPYRARGSGPPDRMPRLQACFRAVAEHIRAKLDPRRLYLGGHSMGGRVASHLAAEGFPAAGLLLLSYPLHPPGEPTQRRSAHLRDVSIPVLCLNGTRDRLCERRRMAAVVRGLGPAWTMHWVAEADHGYGVPRRSGRTPEEVQDEIAAAIRAWRP